MDTIFDYLWRVVFVAEAILGTGLIIALLLSLDALMILGLVTMFLAAM